MRATRRSHQCLGCGQSDGTRSLKPKPPIGKRASLMLTCVVISAAVPAHAQTAGKLPEAVRKYVAVSEPRVALRHVRVIDGTGTAPAEDQALLIADGRIVSVEPDRGARIPKGAKVLDLEGRTVVPGLVMMHEQAAGWTVPRRSSCRKHRSETRQMRAADPAGCRINVPGGYSCAPSPKTPSTT